METFAFPPSTYTAVEVTRAGTIRTSYGASGAPYSSQIGPSRRQVTLSVASHGQNGHGAGYIEALKDMIADRLPIVRVTLPPAHVWTASRGIVPGGGVVTITNGGDVVTLTNDGDPVTLYHRFNAEAVAGGTASAPYLDVTGLPAGELVTVPGMSLLVGSERTLATGKTVAQEGTTRIEVSRPVASGPLIIGSPERADFHVPSLPRAVQTSGPYTFTFEMVEVFGTDFAGGLTEVARW